MQGYGFAISSIHGYSAVRRESRGLKLSAPSDPRESHASRGPVRKLFAPSDSNDSHATSNNSEGYDKPKITSPITGKTYYHHDDDDDKKHGSPSEAYPVKSGDEWHRSNSPVLGSPRKVPNEASRPQRSSPLATPDMRQTTQPKPYNIGNGYGDFGGDKEGRKPIGGSDRNRRYDAPIGGGGYDEDDGYNKERYKPSNGPMRSNRYDGYDGADNGYGGYENNNNKEGNMPNSPVRNGRYDGFDGGSRGYGYKPSGKYDDYDGANKGYGGDKNKEGYKPSSNPMQNGKNDGANSNKDYGGFGNHNNREGYKPINSATQYNGYGGDNKGYDGYGNYNNKEGYNPASSPLQNGISSPVQKDKVGGYDGANKGYDGYGNYNNKEGYNPSSSPLRNGISSPVQKDKVGGYDGANKGYGGLGNYSNKEGYKPISSPTRNEIFGSRLRPEEKFNGSMDPNKPKIVTSWPSSPRKGVQLSQATNDIDKILGSMKETAGNDHASRGRQKATDTQLDDYDNYSRKHDGVDRSAPRNSNWAASLANDSRGKFENGFVVGSPQSQFSVPKLGIPNKNDYRETVDNPRDAASWNGNFSLPSRPQTPLTHVIDGRDANYRPGARAAGPIVDSRFVEQMGGTRI